MRREWAALCALLFGCSTDALPCQHVGDPLVAKSAGCLVLREDEVLLVRGWTGSVAPPGGSADAREPARCAAQREAFEETGLAVDAGEIAAVFDNGFHLFWCQADPLAQPAISRPLEIREVGWWAPEAIAPEAWRYPGQGALISDLIRNRQMSAPTL